MIVLHVKNLATLCTRILLSRTANTSFITETVTTRVEQLSCDDAERFTEWRQVH